MQTERRHDPYAWTWEPAALVLTLTALLTVGALHLGRAIAWWLTTGDLLLPARRQLFVSLPDLVGGDARAGLDGLPVGDVHPELLAASMIITTILLIGGAGLAGAAIWRRLGPSPVRGVATRDEAEELLGLRRLRRAAPIIRPDLHHPDPNNRRGSGQS